MIRNEEGPLRMLNIILLTVGITPLLCDKGNSRRFSYAIQLINYWLILCVTISEFVFMTIHTEDLDSFTELFSNSTMGLIIMIKLLCYLIHRDEIKYIVDVLVLRDYSVDLPFIAHILTQSEVGPKTAELKKIISDSKHRLLKLMGVCLKVFGSVGYLTMLLFFLLPLILETIYPDVYYRELPFGLWYPWNTKEKYFYLLSYSIEIISGTIAFSAFIGIDVLFALMVGLILRQLQLLGFIIPNLDELVAEFAKTDSEQWHRDSTIVLANCAHHYGKLKMLIHRLNTINQPFFICQTLGASVVMCLCLFKIAISDKFAIETSLYYSFEMMVTVQIFICSWVGQQLIDESERFQKNLYSNWWLHDRHYRTIYQMFHASVQNTLHMRIWGSIQLSYATFGYIVKTSMSYFTLLMSLIEE